MSDDTNLVEGIFLEAIDKPRADLDDFLAERCADEGLKQQVLELLAAHDQTSTFFVDKQPVWQGATQDSEVTERVGEQIGPYTLREQIGEGGMGVVYVAEQEKPIRRKVALKVIKPGMDSKTVLARFEAERNALALMNHPNIAKVLEAGSTIAGRPYFVMELVNGCPITQYCDEQKLDIMERLNLFTDVCAAIQHAHQKGIIHRDLKPSNVLITELDGKAVVKVIDFAIAIPSIPPWPDD